MPRKKISLQRETAPDYRFHSALVSKFVNALMEKGKKATAEKIVYGALEIIKKKNGDPTLNTFKQAVENVKPALEVKSPRVGGANLQVPIEVRPERKLSLAFRWLREAARARKGQSMQERLASELLEAAANQGAAVKKREDTHKMAEANKAYAHYKW
ncbi:MAG: 30S ribosomal protein S7 [Candidatus Firestonebacteria bacterium]|nr:30S ribosomal protein S7 [Candidatus Firestonebacteria bacterium]